MKSILADLDIPDRFKLDGILGETFTDETGEHLVRSYSIEWDDIGDGARYVKITTRPIHRDPSEPQLYQKSGIVFTS